MGKTKDIEIANNGQQAISADLNERDNHRPILQQLKRILSNPEFYATEKQKHFLEFVIKESLAGRSDQLKGYTVATKVFGRSQEFDPQLDPIVSVQANKLRRALEHYYLADGQKDPILIEIPKGTYVPVFNERYTVEADADKVEVYPETDTFAKWPAILILPFNNGTGDPDKNYLSMGMSAELAAEISYIQNIIKS